tara:strand:+ start:429 stop:605 length:177 start_codon:yes stop_codon:yes gene_type:complete
MKLEDQLPGLESAINVLKKECDFLGMTFEELLIFIERNPYAMPNKAIKAFEVYLKENK